MLNAIPLHREDGWSVKSPETTPLDVQSLNELTQWIEQTFEYQNTHAVLIEHEGHLVYELYLQGNDERYGEELGQRKLNVNSLHDLRGVTTNITALLVGLAFEENYREVLDKPLSALLGSERFPADSAVGLISLRHVLTMTAGIEWDERSHPFDDLRNDEHQMFLARNPVDYVLKKHMNQKPGEEFVYNGGLSEVLAQVIEQKTGKRIDHFASEALFKPLGINEFEWLGSDRWSNGLPSASSGLRLRARDLAKIGSVFLNQGQWNGRTIVSPEWIELTSEKHVAELGPWTRGNYGYGFHWWPGQSNGIPSQRIVAGFGNGGQQLLIIPDLHLAVTVYGGNYGRYRQELFNWVLGRVLIAYRKQG